MLMEMKDLIGGKESVGSNHSDFYTYQLFQCASVLDCKILDIKHLWVRTGQSQWRVDAGVLLSFHQRLETWEQKSFAKFLTEVKFKWWKHQRVPLWIFMLLLMFFLCTLPGLGNLSGICASLSCHFLASVTQRKPGLQMYCNMLSRTIARGFYFFLHSTVNE